MKNVADIYPLTPTQAGILYHGLRSADPELYFEQVRFDLTGLLDPNFLRDALDIVVQRHPMLRTQFLWEGVPEPVQVVRETVTVPWEIHDWRSLGRSDEEDGTPRYPKVLTELDESYFRRFGEQFIEETRAYRGDAPFFIDKIPNNFFHVGLIKLILPNAKIIDARRHPMGCCFSGFKQLFGEGQEFSYSLQDIGNYYRQYVRLMDHWDEVLPGFVLRVQYEDVVSDLEEQVRCILEFCHLSFEQSCIEFHKTQRAIRTPSAEQVRQPIYTSGLDQWRNFESWLAPLKESLGPIILERYPLD